MAFKEVVSLDCDTTTAIGGVNKKTGKANPKSVEGRFIGTKEVESKLSPTGTAKLHILTTPTGNIGVWGKSDLDRKLATITPGYMIRITHSGMKQSKFGQAYTYRVERDDTDFAPINDTPAESSLTEASGSDTVVDEGEETDMYADESVQDEVIPARATAPKALASVDKARAMAVLAKRNTKVSA